MQNMWRATMAAMTVVVTNHSIENRDRLIDLAARIIAAVSNPRAIAIAMFQDQAPAAIRHDLRHALIREVDAYGETAQETFWKAQRTDSRWFKKADSIVANSVRRAPGKMLALLGYVDRYIRSMRDGDVSNSTHPKKHRLGDEPARKFGAAALPYFDEDDTTEEKAEIRAELGELAAEISHGFERGRYRDGLEPLIERLNDANIALEACGGRASCRGKGTAKHRRLLHAALIQFAEKMLFVANFGVLLDDGKDGNGRANGAQTRKYTDVLQAVGNSILVQADELTARESHGAKLKGRKEAERWALGRASKKNPVRALAGVIEEFSARRRASKAEEEKLKRKLEAVEKELSSAKKTVKTDTGKETKSCKKKVAAGAGLAKLIGEKRSAIDAYRILTGEEKNSKLLSLIKLEKADIAQVALRPAHIASAIRAMDRFRNDLVAKIRDAVTAKAETRNLEDQQGDLEKLQAAERELVAEVADLDGKCDAIDAANRTKNQDCIDLNTAESDLVKKRGEVQVQEKKVTDAEDTLADKTAAIAALIEDTNAVASNVIEHFLRLREATVKAYENAITFTGDVVAQ
jgi:hypothetical protein